MNVANWLAATARLRPQAPALLTGFDLDAEFADVALRPGDVPARADQARQVVAGLNAAVVHRRSGVAKQQRARVPVEQGLSGLPRLVGNVPLRREADVTVRVDEPGDRQRDHGPHYPLHMAARIVPAPLAQIPNALTIGRIFLIPVYVVLITTCDGGRSWAAAIVFGADPNGFVAQRLVVSEGRHALGPRQVLVGDGLARRLDLHPGSTLKVKRRAFTVAGVYHSGVFFEDAGAVLDLKVAQRLERRASDATTIAVQVATDAHNATVTVEVEG